MKNKISKAKTTYQDQRIAEEFCNFRCEYCEGFCPSGYSLATDDKGNLKVPSEWHEKINSSSDKIKSFFKNGRQMEQFYKLGLEVMEKTREIVDTDILKISGGEVTTNKKLLEFVSSVHNKYLSVQILTNGLNLTSDDIKEYKKMGNVSFQVSLDGVTHESNYSKSHSAVITQTVLKNVDTMIAEGIGVEINCVLTKYNTDNFLEYLERFKNAENFMVVPRPVRGEPKEIIGFSEEQALAFEKTIIENFEKYSKILPPKKYMDRLIEIMKTGKRAWNCYIPYFVLSIDGYGNFEKCPIGLLPDTVQNVLDGTASPEYILTESDYNVSNDYQLCKYCIVQYEMLNLYVDNQISKEELKKMPSLNSDIIISHIDEIKEKIITNEIIMNLEREYSIKVDKIEKSDESTDGNVFIVYSKEKKYVIKVYDNIVHTKAMIMLHSTLVSHKLNVPEIINSKENEKYVTLCNKSYFVVYSFIEGEQISWKPQSNRLEEHVVTSIAKMLRKLHTITSDENKYELPKLPFDSEKNNSRCSVLHFDITRNNIFINKSMQDKIGMIDFDDAKYGPSVCDVSITIANLFFSKTRGVDIEGVHKFINEYYYNEPELKERELPLIKIYALKWLDYILAGNEFDTSTTESFTVRRNLIAENLLF